MALAIYDAGGVAPLCNLLFLVSQMLRDPPGRRPRGRRLRTVRDPAVSEALQGGIMQDQLLNSAELALLVLLHALRARRDESAISRDGIDPVARAVLDAGGHIATLKFVTAVHVSRDQLDGMCKEWAEPVVAQLASRPRAQAAMSSLIV